MKLNALVVLCTASLLLSACSQFQGDSSSSTPATPESAYLGKQKTSYGVSPFQVQVAGKFKYRPTIVSGSNPGLQAPTGLTIEPIPFAEYQVYNSAGSLVQAGETDTDGLALIDMPSVEGTYSVRILSRAFNDSLKISVLSDKYSNQPYSISKSFTVTTALIAAGTAYDIGEIVAQAEESISSAIEGGAFNIYFDILLANEYIRTTISQPAWVAEKVVVYWKAGFNPYTYYSANAPALSFYVPGERKLYILGGVNGNVRTADTDHFDDSVILHEYGHFLEDVYGHSDSPGGSHNGSFIIDPRLAWSEGWANYFQAAVRSNSSAVPTANDERNRYYADTYGYKNTLTDPTGGMSFLIDLNKSSTTSGYDNPLTDEGEFREMSIARTLYKATRSAASTVGGVAAAGGDVPFSTIWQTFSSSSTGLRNSGHPTPSMGLFLELLKTNLGAASVTNLNAILTNEKQRSDTQEYADPVTWGSGAACARTLTGSVDLFYPGSSVPRSNLLKSNDFLLFYYNGVAADGSISLAYTPTNSSSGTAMDLDLIVYKASYVYMEDYEYYSGESNEYIVKQSRREPLYESRCTYDSSKICETISLSGQPAGWYMIDVKANGYFKNTNGNYLNRIPNQIDGAVPYNITNSAGTRRLCP
jgi:hypothetical protein